LFGEEVFPVLILTLKLVIGTLNGSLLLLKLADLLLEDFHLLSFLHSAPDSAFSVLEALSGLLVGIRILGVVVRAAPVHNILLQVLLLLL